MALVPGMKLKADKEGRPRIKEAMTKMKYHLESQETVVLKFNNLKRGQ